MVLYPLTVLLLNLTFWPLFLSVTLTFIVIAFPCVYLFHKMVRNPRKTSWLIRRTLDWYGSSSIRCGWPLLRVKYIDHAPQERPPFVFIANHRSSSDGFLVALLSMEAVQVLNIWPAHTPLIGFLARVAGYLKVREMPFEDFLRDGSKLLAEGCSVIAFPEGTRSGSPVMGNFHGSAFRLAQHNKVKIAPLAIWGNEDKPKRGSLILHPGKVIVSKLPSMTPDEYKDMTPFMLKNVVRDRIGKHLDAMST